MALFPTDAKDGQIFAADNGKNYVYQAEKNVWQSTDCVPKWSDQVYIRGVDNQTQQNVNDANQEVNVKVGNVATATNQLLDVAFDVRCRGVWIYQGGAVAPGDPPVGLQRFLMITIQNSSDLGGGSYIVTAIEEFHNDNPDELTETYAIYTVTADTKRCNGSVATEEKAVIRIIPQQAVPALEDEYLPIDGGTLTGQLSCTRPGQTAAGTYIFSVKAEGLEQGKQVAFRVTADGSVKAGHDTGHPFLASSKNDVVTKAFFDTNAATKKYVDDQIAAIPEPEIPEAPVSSFTPCIFTCQAEQNIGLLEPGQFFINDLGSIVLHHAMADGTLWCIKREGRNFVQELAGIVTISELGGRTMFQGTMSKLTTYGTPNNAIHCTLETSAHDKKTCLDGHQYLITIPGILPRWLKV